MPEIILLDDGTLDTVFRCSDCGKVFRFSYQSECDDFGTDGNEDDYEIYRNHIWQQVKDGHQCDDSEHDDI